MVPDFLSSIYDQAVTLRQQTNETTPSTQESTENIDTEAGVEIETGVENLLRDVYKEALLRKSESDALSNLYAS